MEQYRTCSTCKQSKPFSEFSKDNSRKFGISYRCKPCHSKQNLKYYDPEKSRLQSNNFYQKNKEKINSKQRQIRAENPEKHREYKRKYYLKNKERINKVANKWREKNPEPSLRAKRNRRARLRGSSFEKYTVNDVLNVYGNNCYLCNEAIDMSAPRWTALNGWEMGLHIDHVIKIADGGPDNIENVRPVHGLCNLKKG